MNNYVPKSNSKYSVDNKAVSKLKLSKRALNALLFFGIDTIGKLKRCNLYEIKDRPNVGHAIMGEIFDVYERYTKKKLDREAIMKGKFVPELSEEFFIDDDSTTVLRECIRALIENEELGPQRNMDMFKARYAYNENNEKAKALVDIGKGYGLSRERARSLVAVVIKNIKKGCLDAYKNDKHNYFLQLHNRLEYVREKLDKNSSENIIKNKFAKQLLIKEFGDKNITYFKLINMLLDTKFRTEKRLR